MFLWRNLGSWHSYRSYLTYTTYPSTIADQVPCPCGTSTSGWRRPPLDNALCHMAETAQNWAQERDKELEASELPDPSLIGNLWDVHEVHEGPTLDRTWLRLVKAWTQDVWGCSVVWDQLDWHLGNLEAWSMCSAVCHVFQANREQFL